MVNSLKRYFPSDEVEWDPTPRKVSEVSTAPLRRLHPDRVPASEMKMLAESLIQEAITGKVRGEGTADLVVAICDVELANLNYEADIIHHLKLALASKLASYESRTYERYRDLLRARCSFHLLRPLAEAVFFGDPVAMAALRVTRPPVIRLRDVEQFESVDRTWLPICERENQRKHSIGHDWWREELHPKRYLDHLLEHDPKGYDEVRDGASALKQLDWSAVIQGQASPFLRALFEDLSSYFEVPNPLGPGTSSPLTSLTPNSPPDRWLRNL